MSAPIPSLEAIKNRRRGVPNDPAPPTPAPPTPAPQQTPNDVVGPRKRKRTAAIKQHDEEITELKRRQKKKKAKGQKVIEEPEPEAEPEPEPLPLPAVELAPLTESEQSGSETDSGSESDSSSESNSAIPAAASGSRKPEQDLFEDEVDGDDLYADLHTVQPSTRALQASESTTRPLGPSRAFNLPSASTPVSGTPVLSRSTSGAGKQAKPLQATDKHSSTTSSAANPTSFTASGCVPNPSPSTSTISSPLAQPFTQLFASSPWPTPVAIQAPVMIPDLASTNAVGKPKKKKASIGRDAQLEEGPVTKYACKDFKAYMAAAEPFPEGQILQDIAKESWDRANERLRPGLPALPYTDRKYSILTQRLSQFRGFVRDQARAVIKSTYGIALPDSPARIRANSYLIHCLLEKSTFVCGEFEMIPTPASWPLELPEDQTKRSYFYEHEILQEVINKTLFRNKRDLGILFAEWFTPFPLSALALIVTTIEYCLKEWVTGEHVQNRLNGDLDAIRYNTSLANLTIYEEKYPTRCARILERFTKRGRINAKAPEIIAPPAANAMASMDFEQNVDEHEALLH